MNQKKISLNLTNDVQNFTLEKFELSSGIPITNARLGFCAYGTRLENPIIILHPAYTGSAIAVVNENEGNKSQGNGWWTDNIGPAKLLDTNKYTIICVDHFGGNGQSSSASELWEYRHELSYLDTINLTAEFLNQQGIFEVEAAIGGSIGAGQVYNWLLQKKVVIKKIIDISGNNFRHNDAVEFFNIQADLLEQRCSLSKIIQRLTNNTLDLIGQTKEFDYIFNFIIEQLKAISNSIPMFDYQNQELLHITRQIGFLRFVAPQFYIKLNNKIANQQDFKNLENWMIRQGDIFIQRFSKEALYSLCTMDSHSSFFHPKWVADLIAAKNIQLCGYMVDGDTLFDANLNNDYYEQIKKYLPLGKKYLLETYITTDKENGHDHFLSKKFIENWGAIRKWLGTEELRNQVNS